jgi:uncharacterized Tic20 family protein
MEPTGVPQTASPSSSAAITALVLSVVGLVCCGGLLSPFGWYLGQQEVTAVDAGRSAASNRALAQVAVVVGIIGTVLFGLVIAGMLLFGGVAAIASILSGL